jgi:hypothetical protein
MFRSSLKLTSLNNSVVTEHLGSANHMFHGKVLQMQRSIILSLSVLILGLSAFTGCTKDDLPPNFKTSVTITYNGAPVDNALVKMRPDGFQAPTATGLTDADGTIQIFSYKGKGKGVVPGKYKVAIEKQNVKPVVFTDENDPDYGKAEKEVYAERDDLLPAKYVTASRSPLECTVTEDPSQNVFEFNLED